MIPTTKLIADIHRQVIANAGRTQKRLSYSDSLSLLDKEFIVLHHLPTKLWF
jgi:hypothetical protein